MNEYDISWLDSGVWYVPPIASVAFSIVSFIEARKCRGLFGPLITRWVHVIRPSVRVRFRFSFRLNKDGLLRQPFSAVRVNQLKFTFVCCGFFQIENTTGKHRGCCVHPSLLVTVDFFSADSQ